MNNFPTVAGLKVDDLARQLIGYRLPPHRLPLCRNRAPFRQLPPDLVELTALRALSAPEKKGRLTDAVRDVARLSIPAPDDYVVFEAHIDLTEIDDELALALMRLGFEPDDFAKMEPEEYRHHFTLQYVVPAGSDRVAACQHHVTDAAADAARVIAAHATADGYVETEAYRSNYFCVFPERDGSPENEARSPLTTRFVIRSVPRSASEAAATGLPLDVKRAADIHVKILGRFPPYDGTDPRDRLKRVDDDYPAGRRQIKSALLAEGFYEIISEGGNFLYSAHFAEMREANSAFADLVRFGWNRGEVASVVREACTGVWRKRSRSASGEDLLASVPPLLRGSWL